MGYPQILPQALRMAENAFRKYKTRNPFEVMDARNIKLRYYTEPKGLLGFYTVMNRRQIIGLNESASDELQLTGAIHELGHSLNDYRMAASGLCFDDCRFFSLSNAPTEANANLAGAHLFIPDEFILDSIDYAGYDALTAHIRTHIGEYRSPTAKMAFEQEQMLRFYDDHPDMPSYEQLAANLGVVPEVVKFKFRALGYKGYHLPDIPETRADFLKNWQRNACL